MMLGFLFFVWESWLTKSLIIDIEVPSLYHTELILSSGSIKFIKLTRALLKSSKTLKLL